MSWLKDFVAPKIKAIIGTNDNEETLWTKCPSCDRLVYKQELEEHSMVCVYCAHHFKMSPDDRFKLLFDDSKFEVISDIIVKDDPIHFKDLKKYTDRLKDARSKTNAKEAFKMASGTIGGKPAVIFVMDFAFMGGSMGLSIGKSFAKAIHESIRTKSAFVAITASGGARMQEGMLSLMQMPATVAALCYLKEAGLPFINVFTHPTTGGVLASFAMLGDINISEPKALIGFAGARVIEGIIKQKLPPEFQKAEFLKDHGMLDFIVNRKEMKQQISKLLSYMMKN